MRVFAASIGLGLILFAAELYRPAIVDLVGYKEVAIVLVSALGAVLYPVLLFASGGVTVAEVRALARRRRRG